MSRHPRPDPALDQFRQGIAGLFDEDTLVGHVATVVEPFWGLGAPVRIQERVWLLVTWIDGRREQLLEDYPPWTSVTELREGHFVWPDPRGDIDFTTRWLTGAEQQQAWQRWGITSDPSTYMAPP